MQLCTLSHMQRLRNLIWVSWVFDSIDPMTLTTTLAALAAGINPWENNKIGDKYVNSLQYRCSDRDYESDLHCSIHCT